MRHRPILLIFCGLPGSGKTTLARVIAETIPSSFHLQTDVIRSMVARPEFTHRESRLVYSSLILAGREGLRAGYNVFLDGTFPRDEYRREALGRLSRLARRSVVVYVACDTVEAYHRNAARGESAVPWISFHRIESQFEPPRRALRVDTDRYSVEEATAFLLDRLKEVTLRDEVT